MGEHLRSLPIDDPKIRDIVLPDSVKPIRAYDINGHEVSGIARLVGPRGEVLITNRINESGEVVEQRTERRSKHGVVIVPYTPYARSDKYTLAKQWRPQLESYTIGFASGRLETEDFDITSDANDNIWTRGTKELRQELGLLDRIPRFVQNMYVQASDDFDQFSILMVEAPDAGNPRVRRELTRQQELEAHENIIILGSFTEKQIENLERVDSMDDAVMVAAFAIVRQVRKRERHSQKISLANNDLAMARMLQEAQERKSA